MIEDRRLSIFAHFNRDARVDDYVYFYLEALRQVSSHIVFVSTSPLGVSDLARLRDLCFSVIVRENKGYDFGSWQAGIRSVAIEPYEEVVLCNDSVYGPLFPLGEMFEAMEKEECHFWGVTDNHEGVYHLQSYFLVLRKPVIRSEAFRVFLESIGSEVDKATLIRKYEMRLTRTLVTSGFKAGVYARNVPSSIEIGRIGLTNLLRGDMIRALYRWLMRMPVNPTHYYWQDLIDSCRAPFIKIELLRDNPHGMNLVHIDEFLREHTIYPVPLIEGHLERVKSK